MAGNYFKNRLSIAQSAAFVNYLSGRMAESQKSTYFCKKDKKVSDTGREGGGEDRVSR